MSPILLVITDGPTEAAAGEQGIGPMNTFENIHQVSREVALKTIGATACETPAGAEAASVRPEPAVIATRLPIVGRQSGAARAHGLALTFAQDGDGDEADRGEDRFSLLIVDAEGAELQRLGPFGEEDVVAVWRDVAARAGLVRMIVREDGVVAPVGAQLGRVALGRTRMRRRHGSLGARRPRFLARRKTGRLPARPQIHRGESEIIARH